jgi:predicted dehydrogenase
MANPAMMERRRAGRWQFSARTGNRRPGPADAGRYNHGMSTRIAFVGLGGMGQNHLRHFLSLPDCEVVAVAELRADVRARVADRYGIRGRYADHRELLASERVDGIVAIHHYGTHGGLIPDLTETGVPILTEKALARTSAIARRIADAARANRAPVWVGYHKRSDPAMVEALRIIAEWKRTGEMGALRYARVTMPPGDWQPGGFPWAIWSAQHPTPRWDALPWDEAAATRIDNFIAYYSHQLNLLRHVLGEEYQLDYVAPSGVLLAARSASGVAAAFEFDTFRSTVDWQEEVLVTFEKGWIRIEPVAPMAADQPGRLTIFRDPGKGASATICVPVLEKVAAMRRQASYFLAAIRGEAHPLCGADEAARDLEIAERWLEMTAPMQAAAGAR